MKYYANNTSQPRAFYSNGRQYYFGVRVKALRLLINAATQ